MTNHPQSTSSSDHQDTHPTVDAITVDDSDNASLEKESVEGRSANFHEAEIVVRDTQPEQSPAEDSPEEKSSATSTISTSNTTPEQQPLMTGVPMGPDEINWQHTLAGPATVSGRGIFIGDDVTVTIQPAPADHGIFFERTDIDPPVRIPALVANVTERARRTTLRNENATVETVEHCMSALAGLCIDNALIQINGPELPCGDGSAKVYVEAILAAGIVRQDAERRYHRVTEPITVQDGDATIVALPCEKNEFHVLFDLDYGEHEVLHRQLHSFRMGSGRYVEEIAPARTFCPEDEAKAMWDRGLCTHLTTNDVLVIGDKGPIDNPFRFENEPARHKVLDAIGDLYLLGCPIYGRIVAYKSGHRMNHDLCNRLRDQLAAQKRKELLAERPAMDNKDIQRVLHHRYPMLMVDRVVEIEGDRKAIGIKNVTINEPFFQGHYPGTPIMPGVMIVEAMAQLSGLLLSRVLEHTGRLPVLLSLDKVKLRRQVVPGDTLVLEAETIRAQARTANVKCKAFVGDQLAAEARIKFLMVDAEDD